jgi:hypothetical protein
VPHAIPSLPYSSMVTLSSSLNSNHTTADGREVSAQQYRPLHHAVQYSSFASVVLLVNIY